MMIEQGIRIRQERWLSAYDAGMSTRPADIPSWPTSVTKAQQISTETKQNSGANAKCTQNNLLELC